METVHEWAAISQLGDCRACRKAILLKKKAFACAVCGYRIHQKCLLETRTGPCHGTVKAQDLETMRVFSGPLLVHQEPKLHGPKAGKELRSSIRSHAVSNWKKREAFLTRTHMLFLFKNFNAAPSQSIYLPDFLDVQVVPGKKQFSLVPKCLDGQSVKFEVESGGLDDWVEAIRVMIGSKDPKFYKRKVRQLSLDSACRATASLESSVSVKVAEAKDLPAMDLSGTSDPYCLVQVENKIVRTQTIWGTLKPFWGEQYNFTVAEPTTSAVVVRVLDEDKLNSDDSIGEVTVPLSSLEVFKKKEQYFPLQPPRDLGITGDVQIQMKHDGKKLTVKVLGARNLAAKDSNGLSDPFVTLRVGKAKKKTKVVRKNLNPFFNEEFVIDVDAAKRQPLELELWDWDRIGSNDFLGQATVQWFDLEPKSWHRDFYALADRKDKAETDVRDTGKDLGQIRLQLTFKQHYVMASDTYKDFADFLLSEEGSKLVLAMDMTKADKGPLGMTLVKIFDALDCPLRLVNLLTSHEIQQTDNPDIIFRGNTLVTKAMDAFMRLTGPLYLAEVLSPILVLTNEKMKTKSAEVDPLKAEKGEDVAKNLRVLRDTAQAVTERIFESADRCPPIMRAAFAHIRREVEEKYSAEQISIVRFTAVSGFLFLRFFGPTLLNPRLFSLIGENPSKRAARAFTLLCKSVQNLANLVEFGEKEPFMKDMNGWILDNLPAMKTFLDEICTLPGEVADEGSIPKLDLTMELELFRASVEKHLPQLKEQNPDASFMAPLEELMATMEKKKQEGFPAAPSHPAPAPPGNA
mmetsp:Transcript_22265/g.87719  ORF Transcript_22265/g.87719 Transcript_22265/m.87719 type:complete len:801 (-) Transcript_22265:1181-3583(-)|eukprot:CAMPEP_0114623964 /NCGR_PEP_ID=MMETSP0168-20121206/10522_1 /TAXON_ID=95228 ORGANISM="Vannella sp., Strain DIVA3 517/6/12" /NCGR_SAMPLE_ID=MMETSP0168 /ASSEMBLY_ACC=CAM_ASM_000044 /LENGTH=800 /DNA_ID=CAMNT_0001835223 /DNA_START=94 /DNA_END=2496 /DNA_ORIENTATION=+